MSARGLFSIGNLYILLATCLGAALVFAPLAYAFNFESSTNAMIHGSWVEVEHELLQGSQRVEFISLGKLPLQWLFVLCSVCLSVAGAFSLIYQKQTEKQRTWLKRMLILAICQVLIAVVIRIFAYQMLDAVEKSQDLETGFLREFLLHFFVIYFVWRAMRRFSAKQGNPESVKP